MPFSMREPSRMLHRSERKEDGAACGDGCGIIVLDNRNTFTSRAQRLNIIVQYNEHMFKNMNILVTPAFETLTFLGRNYRNSFYVRELAKRLSISTGSASNQLRTLEESGFVKSEQKGRTLLFRANISDPLVREVKIFASLLELSPLITASRDSIVRLILFGSCASGEDTDESDIDLFIETTDRTMVRNLISQYEPGIPRNISPIIVSPEESVQLRTRDRPLFERIQSGKILVGEML
ncbi:MAG: nucleotidyltransferase domain-containing protein [Methanoregula sp.]